MIRTPCGGNDDERSHPWAIFRGGATWHSGGRLLLLLLLLVLVLVLLLVLVLEQEQRERATRNANEQREARTGNANEPGGRSKMKEHEQEHERGE